MKLILVSNAGMESAMYEELIKQLLRLSASEIMRTCTNAQEAETCASQDPENHFVVAPVEYAACLGGRLIQIVAPEYAHKLPKPAKFKLGVLVSARKNESDDKGRQKELRRAMHIAQQIISWVSRFPECKEGYPWGPKPKVRTGGPLKRRTYSYFVRSHRPVARRLAHGHSRPAVTGETVTADKVVEDDTHPHGAYYSSGLALFKAERLA